MSQRLSHHYVPQFHLRLFAGGGRYIHLASRDGSRVVTFASIKGQCARHRFYGDDRVEKWLGNLESRHAAAYRAVLDIAWNAREEPLSDEEDSLLREAILLQRSRTPRNARILALAGDQMLLHTYGEHLKALPTTPDRRATLNAIESGRAALKNSRAASVLTALGMASYAVPVISDLSLLILRNHTRAPFVMGNAPSVFSNHYMRDIRNFGVLGFTSPGLMAVLPIDSRTQVLLYDPAVYSPDYAPAACVDVLRVTDVSVLNALQIHATEACVYFSDADTEAYLCELLTAHPAIPRDQRSGFVVHGPGEILVDGVPNTNEILHTFEPQLPITLDLSFVATAPRPLYQDLNRPRNLDLVQQLEKAPSVAKQPSPLGVEELVRWVESEIVVHGNT